MSILFNVTENGPTDAFSAPGSYAIHLEGLFASATVQIEKYLFHKWRNMQGSLRTSPDDYVYNSEGVSGIFRFNITGASDPNIVIIVDGDAEPIDI